MHIYIQTIGYGYSYPWIIISCGISNLIKVKLSKQLNYFLLYQKSHMWLWLLQLLRYSWYLHSQQLECHQDGRLTALKRNNICEDESLILCILKKMTIYLTGYLTNSVESI